MSEGSRSGRQEGSTAPAASLMSDPKLLGPYRLIQRLGSGGMGVVYEAVDETRGNRVALKTIPRLKPESLHRLKSEFRSVADLAHPNLVRLHELMAEGETWFFTMELVKGVDLFTYLGVGPSRPADLSPMGEERLRAALRQLAQGLYALQAARLLHLDLKPSNILVEPEGRVVLLDFGLARSTLAPSGAKPLSSAGTPHFLSPEQVAGRELTEASDWYSVGLMLFELLTGQPPFPGSLWESLLMRTLQSAQRPSTRRPGIAPDLDELCGGLLEREPAARPRGDEVLRRLGALPEHSAARRSAQAPGLIGREATLEALMREYLRGPLRAPHCVYLRGLAGAGKSALAQAFLERIEQLDQPLLLTARCYERESVPYKGFDALVDRLCEHLRRLPAAEQRALLDEDAHATARIFPVLRSIEALAATPSPQLESLDEPDLRRRAFAGLRKLLARLCEQRRVVLFIDDLQWGDADSARLLQELLAPPDAPPFFLLASYRRDEADGSPFFEELRRKAVPHAPEPGELEVEPLALEESIRLATALLGETEQSEQARWIAEESGGYPAFIEELARYTRSRPSSASVPGSRLSFGEVVHARLAELPEGCRQVLRLAAVAGRPVEQELIIQAAHVAPMEVQTVLSELRAAHMLRMRGLRGTDPIETYHDLIRQNLVAQLTGPELAVAHRALAQVLAGSKRPAPDIIAYHFHGAGEFAVAAEYAVQAAEQAEAVLAFDRASALYAQALEWSQEEPARTRRLQRRRAQALINAGHCATAAPLLLEAAHGASQSEQRELRSMAVEAYLVAGYIDEGLKIVEPLLDELKLTYPSSSIRATLALIKQVLLLQWRGIKFGSRPEFSIPPEQLARVDLCWALGKGLSYVLPVQGTDFMIQSLLGALGMGEPKRVARSLAYMGAGLFAQGGLLARRGEAYLQRAEALAQQTGDPYTHAATLLWRAFSHMFAGRWRLMLDQGERALEFLGTQCMGVSWERAIASGLVSMALDGLGEVSKAGAHSARQMREASERGDMYAQVMFAQFSAFSRLAEGDVDGARELARWALSRWTRKGYTVQYVYSMRIEAYCELYEGHPEAAWQRIVADWPRLVRAHVLRVPMARIDFLLLRARIELSLAERSEPAPLLRACEKSAALLEREKIRLDGKPHAALIRAGIAARQGRRRDAVRLLERAAEHYARLDMELYAACARRHIGELSEDAELVSQADAWMRSCGIHDPARWTRLYAPGFGAAGEFTTA